MSSEQKTTTGAAADDTAHDVPIVVGSLVFGVFFGGVGGGVAFPTLPTLGTVLGITPVLVGVILSTNRFTRVMMNTPAGQLIDTFGTRRPMIVGFFVQALGPFGYVLGLYAELIPIVGPAEIFIFARIMWGFGSAFVFVGAFSTVTHITTDDNRGQWIGYFRGGQSLGFPAGLVLGGILTDLYGYVVAFALSGVTGLFATAVAVVVLPNVRPKMEQPASLADLPRIVRADSRILAIGSVNFAVRFLFAGVLLSTVVLYAESNDIGIASFSAVGASGLIMAVSILSSSLTTVLSGRVSDRLGNRALITLPAMGLLALGFVLLAVRPTLLGAITGVAAIGFGVGGTNPPLLAYLGDLSPDADVGKIGGVYNIFGDLGSTLGPLLAFPLATRLGYRAGYLACAGVVGITAVVVLRTLIGDRIGARQGTATPDND
jgi:MFS family permease